MAENTSLQTVNSQQKAALWLSRMEKFPGMNGIITDSERQPHAFFHILKPKIDADRERYREICEARRQSAEKRWNSGDEKPEEPEECNCMQMMQLDANDANTKTNTKSNNKNNINHKINHNGSSNSGSSGFHLSDADFDRRRQNWLCDLEGLGSAPEYGYRAG